MLDIIEILWYTNIVLLILYTYILGGKKMFCPKCGGKIPDGSKFCGVCGERFSGNESESGDAAPSFEKKTSGAVSKDGAASRIKKKSGKKAVAAAVAAVVLIGAVFGVKSLISSPANDDAYIFYSAGKYDLIRDPDGKKIIEVDQARSDNVSEEMVTFSPDGKYVYYYKKYDNEEETGTLCRAEFGKLKAKSEKNEKYIVTVDTNVQLGLIFLNDGSVTYKNGDDTLFLYNGKETVQVAKNVSSYSTDGTDRIVYTSSGEEGTSVYGLLLSDIENKKKLVSNCFEVINIDDSLDNILYTVKEDDESLSVYLTGFAKDAQKLCQNVDRTIIRDLADEKVYFTAKNGTTLNLYDYVEDSYSDADSAVSEEPQRDDFQTPTYKYNMISGSDLSESDFGELYTSCTKGLYWYGESTWNNYSMKSALDHDWKGGDAIISATQAFIDKFADKADENGYIPVTDEVKAELKKINATDDDTEDWEWLWLCFSKEQSGTELDRDAYNAAREKWNKAKDRNATRETLKDPEKAFPIRTLYCYNNGTVSTVNEGLASCWKFDGVLVFNTAEFFTEKIKLDDVKNEYSVKNMFDINREDENYLFLTESGITCRMSAGAAETFHSAAPLSLHSVGNEVFLKNGKELYVAAVNNGVLGDFTLVSDDAAVMKPIGASELYYMSSVYTNAESMYGDLYRYSNGTSTRVAKDIIFTTLNSHSPICVFKDGTVTAHTGYRSGKGYELTVFNASGEGTIIADDVTQYIRADDSTLMYISGRTLTCFDGKEKITVSNGVDGLWSKKCMEYDSLNPVFDPGDFGYSQGLMEPSLYY